MAFYTADQSYYDFVTPDTWGTKHVFKPGFLYVGGGGGGVTEYWMNKCWDPGGPAWVFWETTPAPDPAGVLYPDPYATGFGGCSNYRVAFKRYQ